jgi:hypothetical protein
MKSGYKILWTDHAISELKDTLEYLEKIGQKWNCQTFQKNQIIQLN